jgi:hypothetical protein
MKLIYTYYLKQTIRDVPFLREYFGIYKKRRKPVDPLLRWNNYRKNQEDAGQTSLPGF